MEKLQVVMFDVACAMLLARRLGDAMGGYATSVLSMLRGEVDRYSTSLESFELESSTIEYAMEPIPWGTFAVNVAAGGDAIFMRSCIFHS